MGRNDGGEDEGEVGDVVSRAVEHGLLRPALELAVVVARTAAEGRPPISPPGPLRPLLRHAKWTPRTMAGVARVIDTDPEFRARVTEAAERLGAEALGSPSSLYLLRPDGWESLLAEEVRAAADAVEQRRSEKEERQARRQLSGLTEELERLRTELETTARHRADLEVELAEQRRERREALARVEELSAAVADAQAAEGQWRGEAEAAKRSSFARGESLRVAEEELRAVRHERARLADQVAELETELAVVRAGRSAEGAATTEMTTTVARAVAEAATAARALGAALGVAAQTLTDRHPDESASSPALPVARSPTRPSPARGPFGGAATGGGPWVPPAPNGPPLSLVTHLGRSAGHRGGVARRPLPLPPAVFEDSPEAAGHLVRAGVLLLVDGYNVSLFAWPELALSAQRHRISTALAELAARTGATIQVVFDGDEDVAYPPARGAARCPVRVVFSDPGVDADEVIIGLVDDHPSERGVVVATNDRRVQDEVRRRGANVLTTRQLLGLLRRAGPRG